MIFRSAQQIHEGACFMKESKLILNNIYITIITLNSTSTKSINLVFPGLVENYF